MASLLHGHGQRQRQVDGQGARRPGGNVSVAVMSEGAVGRRNVECAHGCVGALVDGLAERVVAVVMIARWAERWMHRRVRSVTRLVTADRRRVHVVISVRIGCDGRVAAGFAVHGARIVGCRINKESISGRRKLNLRASRGAAEPHSPGEKALRRNVSM